MRKGDVQWGTVIAVVLLAATTLILLSWWYVQQQAINSHKEVEACRLSVLSYAKSTIDAPSPLTDPHLIDVDCTRRVITFTKDHVELDGKKESYYDPGTGKSASRYATLTPAIVNSVAASELSTCWYEFLEGQSYWTNGVDVNNDDTACFICGELHFDTQAPDYGATPFLDFLATNASRPYPLVVAGQQRPTYLEYLYLEPHICDHSGISKIPGSAQHGAASGVEWYSKDSDESCEQQFLQNVLLGKSVDEFRYVIPSIRIPKVGAVPVASSQIEKIDFKPLMRDLELQRDQSYVILLFQLGEDQDTTKQGEPTGATYAPIIVPYSRFDTTLCGHFIG